MAGTYHDGVGRASICSNGLEVWVTAACRVLDGAARVSQVGSDQTVDMLEVLPSWDPVVSCFGGSFWEVVLKVARVDVLENVPQDLAVLYVLPAFYFLGRLECLHLAMSADCMIVWVGSWCGTHLSRAAANSGAAESAMLFQLSVACMLRIVLSSLPLRIHGE